MPCNAHVQRMCMSSLCACVWSSRMRMSSLCACVCACPAYAYVAYATSRNSVVVAPSQSRAQGFRGSGVCAHPAAMNCLILIHRIAGLHPKLGELVHYCSMRTKTYLCCFCLCIVCARGGFAGRLFVSLARRGVPKLDLGNATLSWYRCLCRLHAGRFQKWT